jgi:alpha-tubulin suppressor-like RCC1 family protein
LPAGAKVAEVETTLLSDFALVTNGRIFAWGDNGDGQLGTGSKTGTGLRPAPVRLPRRLRAVQVSTASNGESVLAVTSSGAIYGWGQNPDGTIGGPFGLGGRGLVRDHSRPIRVG